MSSVEEHGRWRWQREWAGVRRERGGNAGKMNGLLNGMKSPLLADPEPPFLNDVGF